MKFLLMSFILLNTMTVIADENVSESSKPIAKKILSEDNRAQVKYQVTANIGTEYSTTPVTMSLGYHLTSQDLILLRYSNFNGNDYITKLRALTLGYRRFEGNSFNFMPTLYYTKTVDDYGYYSFNGQNYKYDQYKEFGVGIRIGNEWQWEHVVFGVDWIGLNRSLRITRNGQSYAKSTGENVNYTATVLSMNLGVSF